MKSMQDILSAQHIDTFVYVDDELGKDSYFDNAKGKIEQTILNGHHNDDYPFFANGEVWEEEFEKWWEKAVEHAVNSGGELWQDTASRIELFEKFGLIHNDYEDPSLYGACYDTYVAYMKEYGTPGDTVNFTAFVDEIFPNKNDMVEYLQKDQTLLREYRKLDEDKADALIDKYIDKADKMYGQYMHMYLKNLDVLDNKARDRKIADYEKKHDASRGR